jgi:hypothetical protein
MVWMKPSLANAVQISRVKRRPLATFAPFRALPGAGNARKDCLLSMGPLAPAPSATPLIQREYLRTTRGANIFNNLQKILSGAKSAFLARDNIRDNIGGVEIKLPYWKLELNA